jgi:hypothetical protein
LLMYFQNGSIILYIHELIKLRFTFTRCFVIIINNNIYITIIGKECPGDRAYDIHDTDVS